MVEVYHDPLQQLLERGEDLWRRLDHRQALLAEMQELGSQIDEAYRRYESSPRRDTDFAELPLLPIVESFRALFPPRDACSRLELLQVRALLENTLRPTADETHDLSPHANRSTQDPQGLLTAKQVAPLLSLSAQTVYRLAREGRLPYIRLHGSLRFRHGDIENWLRAKSFNPAGGKKSASAGSRIPQDAAASGPPARSAGHGGPLPITVGIEVALGGVQIAVAQQPLHRHNVGTVLQQPRRIGVTELVERRVGRACARSNTLQPP